MFKWLSKYKKTIITVLIAISGWCGFMIQAVKQYVPDQTITTIVATVTTMAKTVDVKETK